MYRARKVFVVPILIATSLGLSACGSSDAADASSGGMKSMATASPTAAEATQNSSPAATGSHNSADVDFATAMIPHHAQAIEMARIVLNRTKNAKVKELATRIETAQTPEIETLSGWLAAWGEPVPDPSMSMGAGMPMDGMMSDADLKRLKSASKAKGDALFLTQMSQHHAGAIAMAEEELGSGSDPDTKAMAQSIKTAQTAEISEMKALLASIG